MFGSSILYAQPCCSDAVCCFLQADIVADDVIFNHLRSCPAVETASSEERSDILPMGGQGYTVCGGAPGTASSS